MKNLRDAPAVVIAFVYMLISVPTMIIALPGLLANENLLGIRVGFDLTSPVNSLLSIINLVNKFSAVIPVLSFILALIICILLGLRKVNSLVVYYLVSILVLIFSTFYVFLFSSSRGVLDYSDSIIGSFYSNYPIIGSSEIFTLITSVCTIIFMSTIIYFLNRYKNLSKPEKVVEEKSVSITEVLKR